MTKSENANWDPDEGRIRQALDIARRATAGPAAATYLERYYAVESNYAGSTFIDLLPNEPNRIDAADLLAATTLSVEIHPAAVRRFFNPQVSREIEDVLTVIDPDLELSDDVVPSAAPLMADFYGLVKSSLRPAGAKSSNRWVTASKICARKRPRLFPVRDRAVCNFLKMTMQYHQDWPVFAALVGDRQIRNQVTEAVYAASSQGAAIGDSTMLLRHLDVILWMSARGL